MKQIKSSQSFYRVTEDTRKDSFKFGRYMYFMILFAIIALIFHVLFSSLYIAEGQGFVSSDHTVIALEHDSTVQSLMVENGDKIQAGQELLFFDSTQFRKELVDLSLKRAALSRDFNEKVINRASLDTKIRASKHYHEIMQKVKKGLYQLKKQGFALNSRITDEEERAYEAMSAMLNYSADRKEIDQQINSLERDLHVAKAHIDEMIENFRRGLFVSPVSGVVGGISANNGSVVQKGDTIMRIYSGKKYLLVYFEETGVSVETGDAVIVHIPGKPYTVGRVVSRSLYSRKLPEELEPTFREPERRLEVLVMIDQQLLEEQPFMTQVSVFKPRGMDTICKVLNCNAHLLDEYQAVLERRKQEKEVRNLQHEVDMFEFFRDKSMTPGNIKVPNKPVQHINLPRNSAPTVNNPVKIIRKNEKRTPQDVEKSVRGNIRVSNARAEYQSLPTNHSSTDNQHDNGFGSNPDSNRGGESSNYQW